MMTALRSQVPTAASTPAEINAGPAQHTSNATTASAPRPVPDRFASPMCCSSLLDPVRADPAARTQVLAVLVGELPALLQDAPHPSIGDAVGHVTARPLPFDEAAPAQARQVIGDLALTDTERVDELGDRAGALEEQIQDGQTGWVTKDPKEPRRRHSEL